MLKTEQSKHYFKKYIMSNKFHRRSDAKDVRIRNAEFEFQKEHPQQTNNGDEIRYGNENYFANFTKGLPHPNPLGEVAPAAYEQLVLATQSGVHTEYENIPMGFLNGRKLTNPQAGWGFDTEGGDAQSYAIPPAPRFSSAEVAAEMVELYWMALTRDVCFSNYGTDADIQSAINDLNTMSNYRGLGPAAGKVNSRNIFRGASPGDRKGPYLSQFLLLDIPFGSLCIEQRQKTASTGVDYLTLYNEWLDAQRGKNLAIAYNPCSVLATDAGVYDPQRKYIRNLRDLATYVHFDALYEAYLNACLILLGMNAPFDKGNPYNNSKSQVGFATFGGPHILSLVTEVATRALKAVWYQKWNVNRRLRPEAFGGRVHNHITGAKAYPIHSDLLTANALLETNTRFGSYLLPQAFPEGSPIHPAYGAGHATVAGACVTILKAWFDESFEIPNPVVASCDGLSLVPYTSADKLTVGGELNKVAANIAIGRNAGGVHYWTDYTASLKLGEDIAISILEEQKETYSESGYFGLYKFDGTAIKI
ncbi:vanadium-dependent haloperoxidase [soil metagenome]